MYEVTTVPSELQVTWKLRIVAGMERSKRPRLRRVRRRSNCPIANTLDLIGDKWTLLVVRDLLLRDKRTYGEIANSPESIPTSVLAERLSRLLKAGLITRSPYQDNPTRYEYRLTEKGAELEPILREMIHWGQKNGLGRAGDEASNAFGHHGNRR